VRDLGRVFVIYSAWCRSCNDTSNIDATSTFGGSVRVLSVRICCQDAAHSPDYHDRRVHTVVGDGAPYIRRLVREAESETHGAGDRRSGARCWWSVRDR
jgi:hypothetical protein